MKIASIAGAALIAASLGFGSATCEEKPLNNVGEGNLALQGYDSVAYFEQGEAVPGNEAIQAEHDGIVYRFTSDADREKFRAAPEKYIPQYGGWCAFGLGMDAGQYGYPRDRYPIDPKTFRIIDGRLYLFFNQDDFNALQHWDRDPETIRREADRFWQELVKRYAGNAKLERGEGDA